MDDMLKSFLISVLANFTTDWAKNLISSLKNARTNDEKIEAINKAKGLIELAASNGTITLNGATLEAFNGIRCDHGAGRIRINQALLKAAEIHTGGIKPDSSGSTIITESHLQSSGATVSLSSGAIIEMTGGVSMSLS